METFKISVNMKHDSAIREYLQNSGYEFVNIGENQYGKQYKVTGDQDVEKTVRNFICSFQNKRL